MQKRLRPGEVVRLIGDLRGDLLAADGTEATVVSTDGILRRGVTVALGGHLVCLARRDVRR